MCQTGKNIKRIKRVKRVFIVLAILSIGFILYINKNQPKPLISQGSYYVTQVFDGDTIEVDMAGKLEKIRMLGVDTPETHKPNTPVQCFGEEASKYTKNNLNHTYVTLQSDTESQNRDKYQRLLRYVISEKGVNWSEELISKGYGFTFTAFPLSKLDTLRALEKQARETNTGLWGGCKTDIQKGKPQTEY